ncbi:hypothetical protein B484DRAFT_457444 [Ochromonadaceae sp. CCMP2298]|nr:hypothetical protein B484DRAFT_457444 [Ochromonadaceae sp. CCMP2298]|mmetsp:Transcript_22546/g.50124  ORF Transcript_22546/g.50124 Transcript_22546/m.50124 type:complete len:173 (-) Transcript_22546:33-551(-)
MQFLAFFALALALISCAADNISNHPDAGSCGNACCRLGLYIRDETTEQVMVKLNSTISKGGPDSRYIPQMTAEGTMTFGDLRPYAKGVDFIGQAWHTTINLLYNDTINFLLKPQEGGKSTAVYAVSISQIAGAYGDDGQNWFNIDQLFSSIEWDNGYKLWNMDGSCPLAVEK